MRKPALSPTHSDLRQECSAGAPEDLWHYHRGVQRRTSSDGIRYLVRLILDDEVRHHRVFDEMANGLKSFVLEVEIEPQVPAMSPRPDPALLEETHRLLAVEKEDAKELRHLRKALKHSPRSSLHPLLVDLMLQDTKKHIAILEHIVSASAAAEGRAAISPSAGRGRGPARAAGSRWCPRRSRGSWRRGRTGRSASPR